MLKRRNERFVPADEVEAVEAFTIAKNNPDGFMRNSRIAAVIRAVDRGIPLEHAQRMWGLTLTPAERDQIARKTPRIKPRTPSAEMG